jgi:hypothetical protein
MAHHKNCFDEVERGTLSCVAIVASPVSCTSLTSRWS